jgi:hypothetical protein
MLCLNAIPCATPFAFFNSYATQLAEMRGSSARMEMTVPMPTPAI